MSNVLGWAWRSALIWALGLALSPQLINSQGTSPTPRVEQYSTLVTQFLSARPGPVIDVQNSGIQVHTVTWNPTSNNLGTCTIQLEFSNDGLGFVPFPATVATSCVAAGKIQGVGTANFIRVNVTALSGGSLNTVYQGSVGLAGVGGNVQGVVAPGAPAQFVFPVIGGGLFPAVNGSFLNLGLDNANIANVAAAINGATQQLVTVPLTKTAGELALAHCAAPVQSTGAQNILGGWTPVNAAIPCNTAGSLNGGWYSQTNTVSGNPLSVQYTATQVGGQEIGTILTFSAGTTVAASGNNLTGNSVTAGQGAVFAIVFASTPCGVQGATGVQGAKYALVKSFVRSDPASNVSCVFVFATTGPFTSTGTENVTPFGITGTPLNGTQNGKQFVTIANFTPTSLTQNSSPLNVDANGNLLVNVATPPSITANATNSADAGTFTATFNGATQTNNAGRGAIITIQLGTVSGTTPTLSAQLQWSPDGGATFLNYGAATANLTATGQTASIVLYPTNTSQSAGATPANFTVGSTVALVENAPLPQTWRLVYTIGGTTPSFQINAVQVNYIQ